MAQKDCTQKVTNVTKLLQNIRTKLLPKAKLHLRKHPAIGNKNSLSKNVAIYPQEPWKPPMNDSMQNALNTNPSKC